MALRAGLWPVNTFRQSLQYGLKTSSANNVCKACRVALAAQQQPARGHDKSTPKDISNTRCFSTSRAISKKSSTNPKSARKSPAVETPKKSEHIPDNKHTRTLDSEPDPYDHTELETAIDHALARLKDALTKTRDAGRVSVQMIEDLPVELHTTTTKGSSSSTTQGGGGSGTSHKEKTRIRDIASVVPKGGRMMQVYISEEGHVKPITNAIQASQHSLVPQPDQQNPLLLNIPVPPATAETRRQAAAEAKKCFDKASLDVRNARGDAQKRHKKMEQLKIVVPDELRKAHKGMEDVAKRGQDEVKRVYENALKALQNP